MCLALSPACVPQWWDGELERRSLLYRARILHDAYATHQEAPTRPVHAYLKARMEAGLALPWVEVAPGQQEGHAIMKWVVQELNKDLFTELVHYFYAPRT